MVSEVAATHDLQTRFDVFASVVVDACVLVRPDGEIIGVRPTADFPQLARLRVGPAPAPDEGTLPGQLALAARSRYPLPVSVRWPDVGLLQGKARRFWTDDQGPVVLLTFSLSDKLQARFAVANRQLETLKHEIERRRVAEESADRYAQTLDAFLSHVPDLVSLADAGGRYVYVNEAFARWVDRRADECVGLRPADLAGHPPLDQLASLDMKALTGEVLELSLDRSEGAKCLLVTTFHVNAGADAYVGQVMTDVSAIKRAEQERLLLERKMLHGQKLESLGVLAGGIAHDFNNLLMGVLGNVGVCQQELPSSSALQEPLNDMQTAALRASELCRQLLAYAGKGRFVVRPVDVTDLVREMVGLLKVTVDKRTSIRLDLREQLPAVQADASQLRQVVMNLVQNASEAMDGTSGVVTVTTRQQDCTAEYLESAFGSFGLRPGPYVALEVSDTGKGMDRETLARIFEPFFTTKFTGRGLGLAAVQGIINGHEGGLRVYSEPGGGTTFKVLLPANSCPARAPPPAKRAPAPGSYSGSVLVVDDDDLVLRAARRILERFGFTVLVASNGNEGVAVHRAHRAQIVLVLLDVTMPGLSGEETLRQIRADSPSVRILLSSGHNEQEVTSRFAGRAQVGFLSKPYTGGQLLDKVEALMTQEEVESSRLSMPSPASGVGANSADTNGVRLNGSGLNGGTANGAAGSGDRPFDAATNGGGPNGVRPARREGRRDEA